MEGRVITETVVELECPWCKRKNKHREYLGMLSGSIPPYKLCFERGENGENISACAILYERSTKEELTFKRLCIPSEMWNYTLDFCRADIADYARELVNTTPKMILITGATPGTGKTGLAVSMLMEFARRIPQSAKFKPFYQIMSDIKRAIERDTDSTVDETIDKYSNIGMLCIDDIGADQTTEYQTSVLYQILNNRMENSKITIVTTNLTGDELVSRFGARIQDRLGSDRVIAIKSTKSRIAERAVIRSFDVS
jgi:DNA replication protein DnaC